MRTAGGAAPGAAPGAAGRAARRPGRRRPAGRRGPLRAALGAALARSARALAHCEDAPGCEAYPPGLFPDFDCKDSKAAAWGGQIDWDSWRRVFKDQPTKLWTEGDGAVYLNAFMDSDEDAMARHWADCPLGVINADMLLYSIATYQQDFETASAYEHRIRQGLTSFPIRILLGSEWPLFSVFTSENLRTARRDIADDPVLNCADLEKPALNWVRFQSMFQGDDRKDWYENTIRYVLSWQMRQIPELLAAECPLGVLTIYAIQAFTCATSESSCFRSYIQRVEAWMASAADFVGVLAHGRWPLAVVLNHMSHSTRHAYRLDFTEGELVGAPAVASALPRPGLPPRALRAALGAAGARAAPLPRELRGLGLWLAGAGGEAGGEAGAPGARSRSFRDALAMLPHLGPGPAAAPALVYATMVYGARFNRHLPRFCARARALGAPGRLVLFTLDEEAHRLCLAENGQRCIRGTPSILNKFTLPLICAHLGLDVVWIDLDVFLMQDPTPALLEHARRGPYDILISGSFESDCICNGIVFFRSTEAVRTWLLAVVIWMYHHPYEHDQKTFSAFLNYTETVQETWFALPEIPRWDTLDPINAFVTPDTFEGNGWTGELSGIVIYHFLNGESDTGSGLDPSGTWMREHGNFNEESGGPPPCRKPGGRGCGGGRTSLMDLFYGQGDEELYTTAKAAHENPAIRRALLASRKASRRLDLLGKPCGPMVGVLGAPAAGTPSVPLSPGELLELARNGQKPPGMANDE